MNQPRKTISHFFDQNMMEKISKMKPEHKDFQENFKKTCKNTLMSENIRQALPPFSFLEFIGVQAKDLLKFYCKGKLLRDYPCRYNELGKVTADLRRQIKEKVTKDFLKQKILDKERAVSGILSEAGNIVLKRYEKSYLEKEDRYQNLLHNLYLDRLPEINTSKFSPEEKREFNKKHYYPFIMRSICCKTRTLGSLRAIERLIKMAYQKNIGSLEDRKAIFKTWQGLKLKPHADLADCELIHLACFGYDGDYCCCWTTDPAELIKKRLGLYCASICGMEKLFYEELPQKSLDWKNFCEKHVPKQRPDWKFGKVIILDKDTGEKVIEISVEKIYEIMRI